MPNHHIAKAAELAPLIERVHGAGHPELTRVRELTMALQTATGRDQADGLFTQLRQVTKNYTLPKDACEAYTAAYTALANADEAHSAA